MSVLSQGVRPQGGGRNEETTSCSGTGVVTMVGWRPSLNGVHSCSTSKLEAKFNNISMNFNTISNPISVRSNDTSNDGK